MDIFFTLGLIYIGFGYFVSIKKRTLSPKYYERLKLKYDIRDERLFLSLESFFYKITGLSAMTGGFVFNVTGKFFYGASTALILIVASVMFYYKSRAKLLIKK